MILQPSIHLSHLVTAALACGGFAAVHHQRHCCAANASSVTFTADVAEVRLVSAGNNHCRFEGVEGVVSL